MLPQETRVFVASSGKHAWIAQRIAFRLSQKHRTQAKAWTECFKSNRVLLKELIGLTSDFNVCVAVFASDDELSNNTKITRDNVIFEAGLFFGSLGPNRVFIFRETNAELSFLSDLQGVLTVNYPAATTEREPFGIDECIDALAEQLATLPPLAVTSHVSRMRDLIDSVPRVEQSPFWEALGQNLGACVQDAKEFWRYGAVYIPQFNNKLLFRDRQFMEKMYAIARTTVFSACDLRYLKNTSTAAWLSILKAQNRSEAHKTRVFVYDSPDQVTSEHRDVFKLNATQGVDVRVFLDDDIEHVNLAKDERDWTLIDDMLVGRTDRFSPPRKAVWYFSEEAIIQKYRNLRDLIRPNALTLTEFLERYPG